MTLLTLLPLQNIRLLLRLPILPLILPLSPLTSLLLVLLLLHTTTTTPLPISRQLLRQKRLQLLLTTHMILIGLCAILPWQADLTEHLNDPQPSKLLDLLVLRGVLAHLKLVQEELRVVEHPSHTPVREPLCGLMGPFVSVVPDLVNEGSEV